MTGASAEGGQAGHGQAEGGQFDDGLGAPDVPRLSHLDSSGHARMVDVSGKDVTARQARASGRVLLSGKAVGALRAGEVPKGDAVAVARIAGIQGATTPGLSLTCISPAAAIARNHTAMTGPNKAATRAVPRDCTANSPIKITTVSGTT